MDEWLGRNHCLQNGTNEYNQYGLRSEKIGLYTNGNPLFGQMSQNSTYLEIMGEFLCEKELEKTYCQNVVQQTMKLEGEV